MFIKFSIETESGGLYSKFELFSGNVVDIQSGAWTGHVSGLGAGLDSFYEYMLKAFIMFGEKEDLEMFNEAYAAIQNHMRRGR